MPTNFLRLHFLQASIPNCIPSPSASLDTWECDEVTWTETVKVLRYYRDNPMRHHLSDEHEPDVKRKRLHLKDGEWSDA